MESKGREGVESKGEGVESKGREGVELKGREVVEEKFERK